MNLTWSTSWPRMYAASPSHSRCLSMLSSAFRPQASWCIIRFPTKGNALLLLICFVDGILLESNFAFSYPRVVVQVKTQWPLQSTVYLIMLTLTYYLFPFLVVLNNNEVQLWIECKKNQTQFITVILNYTFGYKCHSSTV